MSTATISLGAPIVTKKVTGRRVLRFATLDDILADAERLAGGRARQLGNWSPGQAFSHLARTMNMSLDGAKWRAPLIFRLMAPLIKKRLLRGPMKAGFKLPGYAAEQLLPPTPVATDHGLAELRTAIQRLHREPRRAPSPFFGPMTREEWNQLHLRHSELHLSFFVPE